jgi:tetratricopeptide (TPR) repeat protein
MWSLCFASAVLMTTADITPTEARRRRRRRRRRKKKKRKRKRKRKLSRKARIRRRAMRYFRKGKRLYRREKFYRAVQSFERSFDLLRHKNTLLNIAISFAEMENAAMAITFLRKAIKLSGKQAEDLLDGKEYAKLLEMRRQVVIIWVEAPDHEAEIYINRVRVGQHKVEKVLYPGMHRVEIKAENVFELAAGEEKRWVVPDWVTPDIRKRIIEERRRRRRRRKIPFYYMLTTSVIALAAGGTVIYTGIKTDQLAKDFHRTGDPAIERKGKKYRLATNILIGVAAGAAVTSAILAIFTDWGSKKKKEKGPSAIVVPVAGPDGVGLSVSGRF